VRRTTTVKIIKKRQEKIRKIVYNGKYDATDGDTSSKMRDIRNFTSLVSITLNFRR
jgi:hypothetical protein